MERLIYDDGLTALTTGTVADILQFSLSTTGIANMKPKILSMSVFR